MMMPANFSAVNAEVVYGGAVADYLPNAWTAESVKRFNSNIITLVSNSFTSELLKATLGVMFSGNWGEDNRISATTAASLLCTMLATISTLILRTSATRS